MHFTYLSVSTSASCPLFACPIPLSKDRHQTKQEMQVAILLRTGGQGRQNATLHFLTDVHRQADH